MGLEIHGWVVIYFKIPQNVQYVYFRFLSHIIYTCKCENLPEVSLNHAETDAHFVFWRYLWMACWEVVNPGSLRVWHVAARRLRSNRQRRRLWKPWKGVFEKNS